MTMACSVFMLVCLTERGKLFIETLRRNIFPVEVSLDNKKIDRSSLSVRLVPSPLESLRLSVAISV